MSCLCGTRDWNALEEAFAPAAFAEVQQAICASPSEAVLLHAWLRATPSLKKAAGGT